VHFEKLYEDYHKDGVEVAFVVSGASDSIRKGRLPRFGEDFNVSYTALDDKDDAIVALYGLDPSGKLAKNVIVDREGIVRLVGEFASLAKMAQKLQAILGG